MLETIVVGQVEPPSLESSSLTLVTLLDVQVISCVLPAHHSSPPFGIVSVIVADGVNLYTVPLVIELPLLRLMELFAMLRLIVADAPLGVTLMKSLALVAMPIDDEVLAQPHLLHEQLVIVTYRNSTTFEPSYSLTCQEERFSVNGVSSTSL